MDLRLILALTAKGVVRKQHAPYPFTQPLCHSRQRGLYYWAGLFLLLYRRMVITICSTYQNSNATDANNSSDAATC